MRLERIRKVANFMDARFSIAGIRFGFDSIIGLLPGFGDALAGIASLYILWEAYRLGLPQETLGKMLMKIVIDVVVGGIPIVGDLFDVFYKVNRQNLRIIEKHMKNTLA